jgi:hypothetical protein
VPGAAEAEERRRLAERLREVGEWGDADPAADEQRTFDAKPKPLAERAEDPQLVSGRERAEGARPWADRVDQERELALRREAEAHRARQDPTRSLEHEELARHTRLEATPL